jgi:hypothetical protein
MVIYELWAGSLPYFKNNRLLPLEKVQKMKANGVRPQTHELLSGEPRHPFLIACTVVDVKNRWIIDIVVAWLEYEQRLEDIGLAEDKKIEFQRDKERGRDSNPEFASHGILQNLEEAAELRLLAQNMLAWMVKKTIGGAVADSIPGKAPGKATERARPLDHTEM